MKLGIDFDNTLADYTGVFHLVGHKLGWLPDTVGVSKKVVKKFFIDQGDEPAWTALQGIVYGKEINCASVYDGAGSVLRNWLQRGYELHVVSHKTRYPVIGDKTDLHHCAMQWLKSNEIVGNGRLQIPEHHVHFNETRDEKVQTINAFDFDFFIDDLPAVFSEPEFGHRTTKVLFDPDRHYGSPGVADILCHGWSEIALAVD